LAPAWQYKTYLITEWNIVIRLNSQIDNGSVATLPLFAPCGNLTTEAAMAIRQSNEIRGLKG
jgi:hypothetical protein